MFLPLMALTGSIIWAMKTADGLSGVTLVLVHAWAGIVSLPILLAKLVVGVGIWRHKARSAPWRPRAHVLTAGLTLSVVVLYGSGLMMFANLTPGGAHLYKQAHLWAAIVGAGLVTWHLVHYLRRTLRVLNGIARRAQEEHHSSSRRFVLRSFGFGLLGFFTLRGAGQFFADAGSSDPNDFPVTITSGGEDRPDVDTWRMSIDGDVTRPLELGRDDLERRPFERHTYSLDCVLGWSVTREWGGVPLAALLDEVEPEGELLSLRVRSTTGYEDVLAARDARAEGALVAWEVDGVPLTPEHGYPGRLMVPDVIGEKCIKWIEQITVVSSGGGSRGA
jgi:hypothetical protein